MLVSVLFFYFFIIQQLYPSNYFRKKQKPKCPTMQLKELIGDLMCKASVEQTSFHYYWSYEEARFTFLE